MKLLKYAGFVPYLAIAFINASVDLAYKITIQNVLLKSFSGESLVVLTALINAMILLPFIFLFSPSAFINDKFSRTNVIRYSSLAAVVISAGILLSYMTGMFAISFVLTLILAAKVRSILRPNIALLNQLWALKISVWQTVSFKRLLLWPFYLVLLHFLSSLKRIM